MLKMYKNISNKLVLLLKHLEEYYLTFEINYLVMEKIYMKSPREQLFVLLKNLE